MRTELHSTSTDMTAISTFGYFSLPLTLYALPKAGAYLCTKPQRNDTTLDKIRNTLAIIHENIVETVGPKVWYFSRTIIVDNAWISTLALRYLVDRNTQPLSDEQKSAVVIAFFAFSTVSWLVRSGLSLAHPQLKQFIGPTE